MKSPHTSDKRFYRIWVNMKQRCYNKTRYGYHNYGGRGIEVSKRWHSSKNFYKDMYSSYIKHYEENDGDTEIDRINVNGNYSKQNCRWATSKENTRNRRISIIKDIKLDASELSKNLGGSRRLVSRRIKKGWDFATATSLPKLTSRIGLIIINGKEYKTIKDARREMNVSEHLYTLRRNCGYSIEEALSPE